MTRRTVSALFLWLYALASAGIVGFSRAALVVLGGSAFTRDKLTGPLDLSELAIYCLIGSAIQIFDYLDDHPLPAFISTQTTSVVKTAVVQSQVEPKL